MLVVRLNGRLGNQLFQHAFAYGLMRRTGRVVHLYSPDHEEVVDRYFDTSSAVKGLTGALARAARHLPRPIRKKLYKRARARRLIEFDNKLTPAQNLAEKLCDVGRTCCIEGFFQSTPYFDALSQDLRSVFQVRPRYRREFEKVYGACFAGGFVVAVHVRRGDYLSWDGVNYALPEAYFQQAIDIARQQAPGGRSVKFLMLSDDLAWVRAHFRGDEYLIHEGPAPHEIVDLQAMMHANAVITSNSSFSWWGAYLNERRAPVIGPAKWLGFQSGIEYPVGIFPPGWHQLAHEQISPSAQDHR